MGQQKPTRHVAYFNYNHKSIPIAVWICGPILDVHTILFLGMVQVGRMPKIIATECPNGVAIVQGAPHWLAHPSGKDMPEFMYLLALNVYNFIKPQIRQDMNLDIIAESQSVPGVLQLASEQSSAINRIMLLQPLGLNSEVFGATIEQRRKEFALRARRNLRHQLPELIHDSHLRRNSFKLMTFDVRENLMRRAGNHYSAALAYNAIKDLSSVQDKVSIIIGSKDRLFPYEEIAKNLNNNSIFNMRIICIDNIPHSSLSTKAGKALLDRAFDELRMV